VAILSTFPSSQSITGYEWLYGTSMAAPFVTGVAGLIKSVNPTLTNIQIKNLILSNVDIINALNGKVSSGGRLNAYKAILSACTQADLKVQTLNIPIAGYSGDEISVIATVINQGTDSAGNSTLKFYLSSDNLFNINDTYLGYTIIPILGAGATSNTTTTLTIPSCLASGSYYLIAICDALNQVPETNENNNDLHQTILITNNTTNTSLGEALDNNSLTWTTGGNSDWSKVNSNSYYYGDAAQSGDINNDQYSWIRTVIDGPGIFSFYWKVSSEFNFDYLEFYIDGALINQISGEKPWTQKTYNIPDGQHTLLWVYSKDYSISTGSDAGWMDNVVWTPTIEKPDLIVQSIGGPDSCGPGSNILISDIVANQGSALAGSTMVKFYLSTDNIFGQYDTYLGERLVPTLEIGGSNNGLTQIKMPDNIVSGYYYLIGVVDKNNDIPETDETNNQGCSTSNIYIISISTILAESMDNSLEWTTGGDLNWFNQDINSYYGGDSAQSGDLENNQSSWISTTLSGHGILSFYWKVSSEHFFDYLEFYVDGVKMDRISGETDWIKGNYELQNGTHTLTWKYSKDSTLSSGWDAGWLDNMVWTPTIEKPDLIVSSITYPEVIGLGGMISVKDTVLNQGKIAAGVSLVKFYLSKDLLYSPDDIYIFEHVVPFLEANTSLNGTYDIIIPLNITNGRYYLLVLCDPNGIIDESDETNNQASNFSTINIKTTSISLADALDKSLNWNYGGDSTWYNQFQYFYYGDDAAQSGNIGDGQSNWISTDITGPGTIYFYWKVSSEPGYDYLQFYIDGKLMNQISGLTDWSQLKYKLSTGTHTLLWKYNKDTNVSENLDCCWLDRVQWSPTPVPIVVSTIPTSNSTETAVNSPIIINFNKNIYSGTNYSNIYVQNLKTGSYTTISSKVISGNVLTINMASKLNYNTSYMVYIPNGAVKDSSGNILASNYNWTFTTQIDKTPPKITSTTPVGNATGISLNSPIYIKFSENIKTGSKFTNIYVKNLTTGKTVTISKTISGNTLTINQTLGRLRNNQYMVYIPSGAVKDSAGNNLTSTYSFTFRTG
jgi:subtilase family serine protease/methionine-rich copper-binding protein CopC